MSYKQKDIDIKLTLKACRINCNLRIEEVAQYLGKTERTIINWENGDSIPKGDELQKLATLYGVSADYIFLPNKFSLNEFYEEFKNKIKV